jgi:protein TonB
MKKIVLIFLSVVTFSAFSQSKKPTITDENEDSTVYNSVSIDVRPEFPGGIKMFYKFISSNFNTPEEIVNQKISVKIFVSFIVEKDGTISEIKVIKDTQSELAREVIRVIKAMPKWNPGELNGNHVRSSYMIPITVDSN